MSGNISLRSSVREKIKKKTRLDRISDCERCYEEKPVEMKQWTEVLPRGGNSRRHKVIRVCTSEGTTDAKTLSLTWVFFTLIFKISVWLTCNVTLVSGVTLVSRHSDSTTPCDMLFPLQV